MRSIARFVILLLLLAALPLRGVAALAFMQCEQHHAGASLAWQAALEDHGADHDHATHAGAESEGSGSPASSVCSLCAGCCVGSPVAPDFERAFPVAERSFDRTPFVVIHASGHVPERLDRPPLVL